MPDERLAAIAETIGSSELVPATIEFNDIAGLVKGASEGEGLGNQFLAAIRETDAICHVVRCHADEDVPHPDGRVDPLADIETIETELLLADLEQAERRLERVTKQARSGDKEAIAERDWLQAVVTALGEGRPVRSVPVPDAAARRAAAAAGAHLGADPLRRQRRRGRRRGPRGGRPPTPRRPARGGRGQRPDRGRAGRARRGRGGRDARRARGRGLGLERLVRAAYELLDLITFFTAGEDNEAVARPLRRGATALEAAGTIHTEIQDAFIKAEVIGWRDLVEAGGYVAARDRGLLRIEGRDYVVADGDVITIKV